MNPSILNHTSIIFLENIGVFLPYLLLNILASVFGTVGNILIVGSIICTKELHSMTSLIIGNVAVADFFISTISDTFAVLGM